MSGFYVEDKRHVEWEVTIVIARSSSRMWTDFQELAKLSPSPPTMELQVTVHIMTSSYALYVPPGWSSAVVVQSPTLIHIRYLLIYDQHPTWRAASNAERRERGPSAHSLIRGKFRTRVGIKKTVTWLLETSNLSNLSNLKSFSVNSSALFTLLPSMCSDLPYLGIFTSSGLELGFGFRIPPIK